MSQILVVDDFAPLLRSVREALEGMGHGVTEVSSVVRALELPDLAAFDMVLTDLVFERESVHGTALIERARPTPVVVMTGQGSIEKAVEAMKLGAEDFIEKTPRLHDALAVVIGRVLARSRDRRRAAALAHDVARDYPDDGIVGASAAMQEVRKTIAKYAAAIPARMLDGSSRSTLDVLIRGNTGTGKELVARAIHARGARSRGPLVSVNCANVGGDLADSALFGHVRGAFTGATETTSGFFGAAHEGTLFLDEVGELPLAVQAKLLRALQDGRITRLGATSERIVDVHVIAATNRDLREMVRDRAFREDLYFRLKQLELRLPSLCERDDDVELLARSFLPAGVELSAKALEALRTHDWPGNVRELRCAIERAAVLARPDHVITPDLLGLAASADSESPLTVEAVKLKHIRSMILQHQPGCTEVQLAKMLGIAKSTLWRYKILLGLAPPAS